LNKIKLESSSFFETTTFLLRLIAYRCNHRRMPALTERVPISEGKHYKTKRILLQKKRGSLASCNSLSKLYDNSIVDGRTIGEPVLSSSNSSTGVYLIDFNIIGIR
jgi:hypothetical protein